MITAVHKHVARFRLERQTLKDGDLKSILTNVCDNFRKHGAVNGVLITQDSLKAMQFFCKHMIDSSVHRNILRPQTIDHEIFILMENTLFAIVQKDNQLMDYDWGPFQAMALVLTASLPLQQLDDEKVNKLVTKTFFSDRFLSAVKQSMESLVSNLEQSNVTRYRILNYVFQHVYLHTKVHKAKLRAPLLDLAVRCVESTLYIEQFSKGEGIATTAAAADFFLIDCPCFILSNSADRHEEIAKRLCPLLLKDYPKILSYRGQRNNYRSCYLKLLNYCATVAATPPLFSQHSPSIITQLLMIMKDYLTFDGEQAITAITDEELIGTVLTLLYNLTSDPTIVETIKENVSIPMLSSLSGQEQRRITIPKNIQFSAQSLLALVTDNIDELDQPEEITRSSISCLAKAVKSDSHMHAGTHASSVLTTITTIAQNEQVKEQIVEQGALRLLSDCVCDPVIAIEQIRQPALQAMWIVSFNNRARSIWKTDGVLVTRLEGIYQSDGNEEQRAANGILWSLLHQEKFEALYCNIPRMLILPNGQIQHTADENVNVWVPVASPSGLIHVLRENLTAEQSDTLNAEREQRKMLQTQTSQPYKYDLMISYCHKNKDLCKIIYDCLVKMNKYKIWIDHEQMHGSTMDRMAEAIEESHLMLVCMSSAYRNSPACQAEGEYAFARRQNVLFLKVEANYQPSGWLGLFLGAQTYVDVTKKDFLTTFKDIVKQISIKRNEAPDDSLIDKIVTLDVQTAFANALKAKEKSKSSPSDHHVHPSASLPTLPILTQFKDLATIPSISSQKTLSVDAIACPDKTSAAVPKSEKKIVKENVTPEKLTKYYPSRYAYESVCDDSASINDITFSLPLSNVLSLSDEDLSIGHDLPSPMNGNTISLSDLSLNTSNSSPSASSTSHPYLNKPVSEWTREEVLQFLQEKNLTSMCALFSNPTDNGKRLLEISKTNRPASSGTTTLDYQRLADELKKLPSISTSK